MEITVSDSETGVAFALTSISALIHVRLLIQSAGNRELIEKRITRVQENDDIHDA
jgi:hypothetical protein